jgi:hypothetical protein
VNGIAPGAALQTQLFTLAVVVFVVARFLFRELRARTVKVSTMWVRPAILAVLTAFVVCAALQSRGGSPAEVALSLGIGVAFGALVGLLVTRSTQVGPGDKPGYLRLRGSWVTVAIWIVALALRLGVRLVASGGSLATAGSLVATAGTVSMVAAAFGTFAALIARKSVRGL